MADKNLALSKTLKQETKDYVWQHRLPGMGSVVQDIIREYAAGTLSVEVTRTPLFDDEIKYTAPPEYPQALARARAEGATLSDVIRVALAQRVKDSSP